MTDRYFLNKENKLIFIENTGLFQEQAYLPVACRYCVRLIR